MNQAAFWVWEKVWKDGSGVDGNMVEGLEFQGGCRKRGGREDALASLDRKSNNFNPGRLRRREGEQRSVAVERERKGGWGEIGDGLRWWCRGGDYG